MAIRSWLHTRRTRPNTRIFRLGFLVTLFWALASVALVSGLTLIATWFLITSIDDSLGIELGHDWIEARLWPPGYRLRTLGPAASLADDTRLENYCAPPDGEGPPDLARLRENLEAASTTRATFRAICTALTSYRAAAGAETFGIVAGKPRPPGVTRNVLPVALPKCSDESNAPGLRDADLGWYPARCLLRRIRSVGLTDGASLFILDEISTSGLQGNLYDFAHSRAVKRTRDPDLIAWETEESDPDGYDLQVQTLQQALNRLDKVVLPAVEGMEASLWLQRFILRAINQPYQFAMLILGTFAALLYIDQRLRVSRRFWKGRHRPAKLKEEIRKQVDISARHSKSSLRPYTSELRNVVDEFHLASETRGKAVPDTISDWIPMLGFIGTVFGMIGAMDAIGGVISADQGPELYTAMSAVTTQLSLAFYTTFVALILSLLLTFLRRWVIAVETQAIHDAVADFRHEPQLEDS